MHSHTDCSVHTSDLCDKNGIQATPQQRHLGILAPTVCKVVIQTKALFILIQCSSLIPSKQAFHPTWLFLHLTTCVLIYKNQTNDLKDWGLKHKHFFSKFGHSEEKILSSSKTTQNTMLLLFYGRLVFFLSFPHKSQLNLPVPVSVVQLDFFCIKFYI